MRVLLIVKGLADSPPSNMYRPPFPGDIGRWAPDFDVVSYVDIYRNHHDTNYLSAIINGYDYISFPSPSDEMYNEEYNIYDIIRELTDAKLGIYLGIPLINKLCGHWMLPQLIASLNRMDVILVPNPTLIPSYSLFIDVPMYHMDLPIDCNRVSHRSNIKSNGIYIAQYDPSQSGLHSYIVASKLSREYDLTMYANGSDGAKTFWCDEAYNDHINAGSNVLEPVEDIKWERDYSIHLNRLSEFQLVIFLSSNDDAVGRIILDCAAAGTPCISYDTSHLANILFPDIISPLNNIGAAYQHAKALLDDRRYYNEVVDYSTDKLSVFTYEEVYQKLMPVITSIVEDK